MSKIKLAEWRLTQEIISTAQCDAVQGGVNICQYKLKLLV